jgi:hypothetical protein
MPPRLAFNMLSDLDISSQSPSMSRTPWDEMSSVFLCLLHAIWDRRRDPDAPLDRKAMLGNITTHMAELLLLGDLERICAVRLRPLYKGNPTLPSCIRKATEVLFPSRDWYNPPPDAGSLEWWNRMRNILDSLVAT